MREGSRVQTLPAEAPYSPLQVPAGACGRPPSARSPDRSMTEQSRSRCASLGDHTDSRVGGAQEGRDLLVGDLAEVTVAD